MERVIYSKGDNIEIMINDKTDEVIKKLFKSLKNRYQDNLEKRMKSSEFIFDYVYLLYYKCYKINPIRDGSYIESPNWIKKGNKISIRCNSRVKS